MFNERNPICILLHLCGSVFAYVYMHMHTHICCCTVQAAFRAAQAAMDLLFISKFKDPYYQVDEDAWHPFEIEDDGGRRMHKSRVMLHHK